MREGIAQIHLLHPSIGHLRLSRYPFEGPYNKDYSILGSILGSFILGNYHIANAQGFQHMRLSDLSLSIECVPGPGQFRL